MVVEVQRPSHGLSSWRVSLWVVRFRRRCRQSGRCRYRRQVRVRVRVYRWRHGSKLEGQWVSEMVGFVLVLTGIR